MKRREIKRLLTDLLRYLVTSIISLQCSVPLGNVLN